MVFEKVRSIISDQFGVDEDTITLDTSFKEDLNADSLDMVEVIMALEEEFDIGEIEEDAVNNIETVGDAVAFISNLV
ncbi:MAG TPA: acyl carrier protein [Clostridiales bacterium]|jgi:acyl carrier protein|nr:acyl carrier protein [Clostridiales bacterium]